MASGLRGLGPVVADETRNIVVGVDVLDRPHDVRGPVATPSGGKDRGLQYLGRQLVLIGRSPEFLLRLVVHASQCLMFLDCGHDPMLHDTFAV